MINLLPDQVRQNIIYGRRNTRLWHWIIISLLAVGGLLVLSAAGRIIIDRSAEQARRQTEIARQQLASQKLDETQGRVKEISSNLKLATQVLSKQVMLSDMIQHIATILPSGSALSGLQLTETEGGMDLTILATDFQVATQVQINLRDPANRLFSQADTNAITCTGNTDPRYACTASFRVLFADDNPYKFAGSEAKP